MIPGIQLVHKPIGPTSFSFLQTYRQATSGGGGKGDNLRVCHGGTLDPFASGLLLILVEPATRLFDYLHDVPKIYEATVAWGVETDNGDPNGKVTLTGDASSVTAERLEELLPNFLGWREQVPPAHSAKRIGGERAYLKAHRGETVEMPASQVYLHEAVWVRHDLPRQSVLRVTVRGGYYVRALVRDLGRILGCGAHLAALHRAAIGPWSDPGADKTVELHGREILPWLPMRILTDQEVGDLRQGGAIAPGELLPPDWELPAGFPTQPQIRGFHLNRFAFLLTENNGRLQPTVILPGGL